MTSLAGETLAYNPEFYNKISYLLHEIGGEKSPLEKQALESGYYDWLKQPGMMKIPFFQKNPLYLNVANMIPHYTMNILQPPERNYKNRFGAQVSGLIDKTPFFKTPDGQILFDYVLMPAILQGERPQGVFGQPLWEKDAGLIKKSGYAARTFLESLTPPAIGYAGLGAVAGLPPEDLIKYFPSYNYRKIAYPTVGKTNIGTTLKGSAAEKVMQAIAATSGLPTYSVK